MGFAAAEPANVPAGAEGAAAAVDVGAAGMDGEGAEVPFAAPADGDGDDGLAAAVTLAACLEPKMADTILPKTLIFSSYFWSCSQATAPAPEGCARLRSICK